ncbi:hypothetical protein K469DRAFT_759546 [Zopfia rhizophila CBS 207.26]|uniref:Uncharacterized protein n=1 Tax=Zopfia rhizophila CBS 207.26 TaxID=1314779 RepID=A0A6A6EEC3_9PEZI|nr:hypothetical protein K469DRAFT_759546 [Zopfia rhizophila CBS 207.26]
MADPDRTVLCDDHSGFDGLRERPSNQAAFRYLSLIDKIYDVIRKAVIAFITYPTGDSYNRLSRRLHQRWLRREQIGVSRCEGGRATPTLRLGRIDTKLGLRAQDSKVDSQGKGIVEWREGDGEGTEGEEREGEERERDGRRTSTGRRARGKGRRSRRKEGKRENRKERERKEGKEGPGQRRRRRREGSELEVNSEENMRRLSALLKHSSRVWRVRQGWPSRAMIGGRSHPRIRYINNPAPEEAVTEHKPKDNKA